MQCAACHAFIPLDSAFCHKCGVRVQKAVTGPTQRLVPAANETTRSQAISATPAEPPAEVGDIRRGECPKCGSHDIVPNRPILDHGHAQVYDLQLELDERPEALLFKGQHVSSILAAWICGACGYTELYATNHQQLYTLYRRSPNRR